MKISTPTAIEFVKINIASASVLKICSLNYNVILYIKILYYTLYYIG